MSCSIEGCERPAKARGWCNAHWLRWRNHGDPTAGPPTRDELHRALDEILRAETDDCVLWPYNTSHGYGTFRSNGKRLRVHVLACEHHHGPRPEGRDAAHSCGNPTCANWRHLRWATRIENMADRVAHGTSPRGERAWNAKVTAAQVIEIRRRPETESRVSLAREFGVSRGVVRAILDRRSWAWLDQPPVA